MVCCRCRYCMETGELKRAVCCQQPPLADSISALTATNALPSPRSSRDTLGPTPENDLSPATCAVTEPRPRRISSGMLPRSTNKDDLTPDGRSTSRSLLQSCWGRYKLTSGGRHPTSNLSIRINVGKCVNYCPSSNVHLQMSLPSS